MPSLPNAKVPLYPTTTVPAVPGKPDISVAQGLGEVGVVTETNPPVAAVDAVLAIGRCGLKKKFDN